MHHLLLPVRAAYAGIIMTVAHKKFSALKNKFKNLLADSSGVLVDVRGMYANPHPPKGVTYKTL